MKRRIKKERARRERERKVDLMLPFFESCNLLAQLSLLLLRILELSLRMRKIKKSHKQESSKNENKKYDCGITEENKS